MEPLDELQRLVPPPLKPRASSGDWGKVEQDLGVLLPDDYKAYISTYGSGRLCKFFEIVNPLDLSQSPRRYWIVLASIYGSMAELGEKIDRPHFPDVPGLLPCAGYGDVNYVNWFTEGASGEWPLVYYSRDDGMFDLGRIGIVEFILSVLKGDSPLI